ncbi:MAG: hypothetical protein RBT81_01225 [Gammaproteobacteria bacterium]|jgi:hypothetical protein|nr:hypothetical protein [Gammaproteobacteria bacterium]
MRLATRHTVLFGLYALFSASGAWAVGELDVTIRVIERHERLEDFSHRIELPRENATARERIPARWQDEDESHFRETGDHGDAEQFERSRGEFERQAPQERAREWSRERDKGRGEWRRDDRRTSAAEDRPRH